MRPRTRSSTLIKIKKTYLFAVYHYTDISFHFISYKLQLSFQKETNFEQNVEKIEQKHGDREHKRRPEQKVTRKNSVKKAGINKLLQTGRQIKWGK